jgi:parvulin-like peptidyl-prolyl isomerase
MKEFLKEPLVHFLLIGLGIFYLYALVGSDDDPQDTIVISDSDLTHLKEVWKLRWQREPTEEELVGIVSATIREEILYREALKMNLDHDDEVVKRRLAQKMDFLSNDISALVNQATDEDLRAYYETHSEKYMLPARYSFRQIIFTSDVREDPRHQAENALRLIGEGQVRADNLGDPLSLPGYYEDITANRLQTEFGGDMGAALADLPVQEWAGPVRSGYGWHLVYIEEREPAREPPFEEVRDELERDYAYEKEKESQQRIYQELRNGYDIKLQAQISTDLSRQIMEKING